MTPVESPKRIIADAERGLLEDRCRKILQGEISDSETFHEFALNLAKLVGGVEEDGMVHSDELTDRYSVIKLTAGVHSTFVSIEIFTTPDWRTVGGMGVRENVLSVSPDEFSPICQRNVMLNTDKIVCPYINDGRKMPNITNIGNFKLIPDLVKNLCQRLFDAY